MTVTEWLDAQPELTERILSRAVSRTALILSGAREIVDAQFGEGFATSHPEILKICFDAISESVENDLMDAAAACGDDDDDDEGEEE